MSAMIFNYFDNWREADLVCPHCGWKGRIDPEQVNVYRELADFACPKCATTLAIVSFPTETEIREHWNDLSEEDRQVYGRRFELDAEFARHHLTEPSQLPDIDDDPLVLVWDFETGASEFSGPSYTVLKHNGRSIWRERAYFECVARFGEVVDVLHRKYGKRLKDLVATDASRLYLGGDDLRAWDKLEDFRARMSPRSVDPELRLHALATADDKAANNFLRYRKEIGEHCLRTGDQLPAIDGEPFILGCTLAEDPPCVSVRCEIDDEGEETFHLDWDKQSGNGCVYLSLFHNDREIWKEAAPPPDHPGRIADNPGFGRGHTYADLLEQNVFAKRFAEIADILKQKYGTRIKDVVMTYASRPYGYFYDKRAIRAVRGRCFLRGAADRDRDTTLHEALQRAKAHGATVKRAAKVAENP
jgi:hypothetical protein